MIEREIFRVKLHGKMMARGKKAKILQDFGNSDTISTS